MTEAQSKIYYYVLQKLRLISFKQMLNYLFQQQQVSSAHL